MLQEVPIPRPIHSPVLSPQPHETIRLHRKDADSAGYDRGRVSVANDATFLGKTVTNTVTFDSDERQHDTDHRDFIHVVLGAKEYGMADDKHAHMRVDLSICQNDARASF